MSAILLTTCHPTGAQDVVARAPFDARGAMKGKFVRVLLIVWPCVACLGLAALPPIFAQESKPLAKMPNIQGTWDLVSWERNGKDQKLQRVRIFITDSHISSDGVPLPDDKGFMSWPYELD